MNSEHDQFPVSLIHVAQLAEHCTGIAEVMGSNPVQAWIFVRFFCNSLVAYITVQEFFFYITFLFFF